MVRARRLLGIYSDVSKTYWIEPERVVAALDFPGDPSPIAEHGVVRDGDWDRSRIEWGNMDAWNAFVAHFRDARPWQQTEWYHRLLDEIACRRRAPYGCTTKDALDARFRRVDSLYREIKNAGYTLQVERRPQLSGTLWEHDEVTVHIDRNGHYLFGDGRHRLFIAKLLGLQNIPVKVARRHRKWVRFRQEILDYAQRNGGTVYQPLLHPDLADIPSTHGHARFDLMAPHLRHKCGTVLDLGANWGYFCNRCERWGYKCTAVESFPTELYFLRRLRAAEGCSFRIEARSLLDLHGLIVYDVVLALNIFHHFLKNRADYSKWIAFLSRLRARQLFFEAHDWNEPQMQGSYKNYRPAEFARLVARECHMTEVRPLGRTTDNRVLYMLSE